MRLRWNATFLRIGEIALKKAIYFPGLSQRDWLPFSVYSKRSELHPQTV